MVKPINQSGTIYTYTMIVDEINPWTLISKLEIIIEYLAKKVPKKEEDGEE